MLVLYSLSMDTNVKLRRFSNRDLGKLILPLVIEQALAMLVGFLDAVMVSSLGEAPGSGVSLVDMINNLIFSLFAALATGGAVVASQFMGSGKEEDARKTASQLIVVALVISALTMAVSLVFNQAIIRLFFGKIEADVMEACVDYFYVTACSFPFLGVYNACAALFRTMGKSSITMIISLISNVFNFIGNYILIYIVKWGVAGAAFSTLIARGIAMVLILVCLTSRKNVIYLSFRGKFRPNVSLIKRILYIGIPSGVENSLFQLGRVLVVSFVTGYGTAQIAANAVGNTICGIACVAGQAMGLAMVTVVGQCVGEGDEEQLRYYIRKMMGIAYLLHGVLNVILILLLPLILKLYTGYTQETLDLSYQLIMLHCISGILIWPISFVFPNALRAANDVTFTMVVAVASMAVFRISFSYILGTVFEWNVFGVWIAMIVDWVCRSLCFFFRYRSNAWKKYAHLRKPDSHSVRT